MLNSDLRISNITLCIGFIQLETHAKNAFLRAAFIGISLLFLQSCALKAPSEHAILNIARNYFEVYAERQDFDRFMDFYADDAQLNDIIYGNHVSNKIEIRQFLHWRKGDFKLHLGSKALTVISQTVNNKTVFTEGYFHKFTYDKQSLGPWLFIIKLEFNDNGKIIKQTDWINYTPREQFLGGENMNSTLIEESTDNQ